MIAFTIFTVSVVLIVVGAILFFPPIVRVRQRSVRGYADDDVTRVHQKMVEAREQQKPFHMSVYECNALRATTNDFREEVVSAEGYDNDRQ